MQPWARAAPYCSVFYPFGVAKSSTNFGWNNCGNVTSVEWQVTLCDPIWHVSSRSGEAVLLTKGEPLYSVYLLTLLTYKLPSIDDRGQTDRVTIFLANPYLTLDLHP